MPVNPRQLQRPTKGFTIIELIVVVALVAIMGSIAAPSFSGMIATSRVKGAATSLHVSLLKARSEAIKRNASVRLVRNGGNWGQGWQMLDAANNVLGNEPAPVGVAIAPTTPTTITYMRSGRLQGATAPLFTITATKTDQVRCVSVGLSGMPTVRKIKTADLPC